MTIILLLKEYLVLTALILLSLVLLSFNDNPQIRAIRTYAVGIVGFAQNAVSVVPNFFALQRENELLRQLSVNLSDEVSRLREARLENARLRELLILKERSPFHLVAAEVVGKSIHLQRNTMTINVGEQNGVMPNMPIICETGLVGRVVAASAHYALCQLVLNVDFRASARVQRSRVVGIVAWDGGEYLHLKNVARTLDVIVGDVILTSEYSNVYPRDIKLGTVVQISEREGGLFKDVLVKPSVDFASVEQIFVITALPDPERELLERKVVGAR